MNPDTIPGLPTRAASVVSRRFRFLYLAIAKNASSTLKEDLSSERCGGEVVPRALVPVEAWERYFAFAFLRDPVERLLSAYQEVSLRIQRQELEPRPFAAMTDGRARFLAFLADLETNGAWNEHVATQAAFLAGTRVDFWGRVETLQSDLQKIYARLGIGRCPPLPRRRPRQLPYLVRRVDLDAPTIERIRALYRDDAELIAARCREDGDSDDEATVRLTIALADGAEHAIELPQGHPALAEMLAGHDPESDAGCRPKLLQVPLEFGRAALTFSPRHLVRLEITRAARAAVTIDATVAAPAARLPAGTHPHTNIDEGHLGGYVRAVAAPTRDTVATPHGDPATWYPRLWQWLVEELGVRSVLDVGCGEGHAAGFFRDAGCEVLGVDGSRQARIESVVAGNHTVHDFSDGPFVPDRSFDLIWSCEFVEHVEARFTHNFLATFAAARRYLLMTFAVPGQPGWHHVNCRDRSYWLDKLQRLGFEPDEALRARARDLAGQGHFQHTGEVFVRRDERGRASFVPGGAADQTACRSDPLPILSMEAGRDEHGPFYLFHDIFVHPIRRKIVAVCSYYGADWNPADDGIDYDAVDLVLGHRRIRGRCLRHRLDSWEPCIVLEFAAPEIEAAVRHGEDIDIAIEAGAHSQRFRLPTRPPPAHRVAMSLVVRNENRWIRVFLQYYLDCLRADHVFLYDNGTEDRHGMLEILDPYRRAGRVTYIPWDFRWRNRTDRKMTAQPAQEAHSLNRFANTRWIGFFDIDEFLRLPDTTLPAFLERFSAVQVDGLSFGIRWFAYRGALELEQVDTPPLTFLYSRPDERGRKRQKLFVKGGSTRFARLHWLEEGRRELPIDDSEIFFHHYEQRPARFAEGKSQPGDYDDYMLRFRNLLSAQAKRARPAGEREWIEHIGAAIAAAEQCRSQLADEVLAVDGMCGRYNRHFYNNLCNFAGCRFLEIGSYHGASTCAALYGNEVSAVCIDNWTEFQGRRGRFEEAVRRFRGRSSVDLIEQDCFEVDASRLGPFDVFLYDGKHDRQSQYRAIEHYAPTLAEYAVVVIDDWNRPQVRQGTRQALRDLELDVVFEREILPVDSATADVDRDAGAGGWWNGLCLMLLRQRR